MNLYNPTLDVIEDRYKGFSYVIGPEQELSVSDDTGNHLLMRRERYGLVCLDYSSSIEQKFGSLKEFKKVKRKQGLDAYKAWLDQCLTQEKLFPREVQLKNGGEVESSTTRVPYFQNKIKEIDFLLKKNDPEKEVSEAIPSEVAAPAKRRGRKPYKVKAVEALNVQSGAAQG